MSIQKQNQLKLSYVCIDGNCPEGVESLRKIGLTPREKRTIFFGLKEQIFKQKQLLRNLPLF